MSTTPEALLAQAIHRLSLSIAVKTTPDSLKLQGKTLDELVVYALNNTFANTTALVHGNRGSATSDLLTPPGTL